MILYNNSRSWAFKTYATIIIFILLLKRYITRGGNLIKKCETNQFVSNAWVKYRVPPPIWNRDNILFRRRSYFACNTNRMATVRTQSMQSPLLAVRRSSTVSNRWTNARRGARVGRRRWNAERSEPVSAACLIFLCLPPRYTTRRRSAVP